MILVTLGTQKEPFTRLLNYLENSNIKDEIIVQAGYTEFKSKKMKIFDFISYDEMNKYIDEADLIITHAGTGSILMPLKKGKKIIACARLKKFAEHVDDHQEQIIEVFKEEKYILEVNEENNLDDLIKEMKNFKPKKYISNSNQFIEKLKAEIDNDSKSSKKGLIDKLFLAIVITLIVVCSLNPIINPTEVNYAENRTANKIPIFNTENFLNGTYQNAYETALADQIPMSDNMKSLKKSSDLFMKILYSKFHDEGLYQYIGDEIYLVDDYLVYKMETIENHKEGYDSRIKNINNVAKKLDDLKLYLYYIEKDADINFETNKKSGIYEYIKNSLDSKIKTSKFEINNFKEYKDLYYRTDHHWNYKGSYKGYLELLKLMDITEEPQKYKREFCLSSIHNGSKSRTIGGTIYFNEKFCSYEFDYPPHTIYIDNALAQSYGDFATLANIVPKQVSYGEWYGWDNGLVYFNYNQPEKENLLIIGDSFDNPISALLASHFNNTYNVDLRYYENSMGGKFDIVEFTKKYDIDRVLFVGNMVYYWSYYFEIGGVN